MNHRSRLSKAPADLLTTWELCRRMGITEPSLRAHKAKGHFVATKHYFLKGRRLWWVYSEVLKYFSEG